VNHGRSARLVQVIAARSTSGVRRSGRPSARAALAALALSACAAGSLAVTASAGATVTKGTPLTRATSGSGYLALGDSVTFGYQEPTVVPAPDYHNASSFLGYPEQLGAALHLIVANPACPGETSASFVNPSAPSNDCENGPSPASPKYRLLYPLHVRYRGSQLAYALGYLHTHPNIRLVSLMLGANDLFLCQKTTVDACASSAERHATFARVTANMRLILSAIRNRAHYRGQLAIVHYYSLNYASSVIDGLTIELNQAQDAAARPFHVVTADGFDELKAAALHSGGNTCAAGILTQLGSPGTCGVHPSYAGQALLAQALEKVIRF
jgi:lysophospholipase L1-like esterase